MLRLTDCDRRSDVLPQPHQDLARPGSHIKEMTDNVFDEVSLRLQLYLFGRFVFLMITSLSNTRRKMLV